MVLILFAISFLSAFLAAYLWEEKKRLNRQAENIVKAFFISNEDHEQKGDKTCEKCKKKFCPSSFHCTWDPVMTVDGDGYYYKCPHCHHSWTELVKIIISKTVV